ncbi:MAG: tryptophan synthase subunit alpha [Clostridiales bacterium]|nr:tryptophan synthase subunit alpha [Clostridiales bacterium]
MKNRIDICFENLKKEDKKALITFITAGDAGIDTTEKLVLEMFDNGADIVELGVPFSDPIAEGPTIQKSSLRSLKNGTTLDKLFDLVKSLREKTDKPLVFMMYLNTIYRYGVDRFFKNCSNIGIDGVIVPDMPFEEKDEIQAQADQYGVYNISLIAPTSHERIKMIAKESKGFIYCVSSTGVTGTRSDFATDFNDFFELINENVTCPACVGFGISNGEQAKEMSKYCDGVIVGSAIVNIIAELQEDSVSRVGSFTKELKTSMS